LNYVHEKVIIVPNNYYGDNYARRLKPLQLHSRVITETLAFYPIVVATVIDGAHKVRCVTPFISQIKGFRRSNRDKGITLVGNAFRMRSWAWVDGRIAV